MLALCDGNPAGDKGLEGGCHINGFLEVHLLWGVLHLWDKVFVGSVI